MQRAVIPPVHAHRAWRDEARRFLAAGTPPDQILWGDASREEDLFVSAEPPPGAGGISVPRGFINLANTVVWHSDPERFARLYAFLWRLQTKRNLMGDRGDADLVRLRTMEKAVRRCQHKMKAFVRFREIGCKGAARRSFAAWFEPTHHTVEPTADFFAHRFGDMDWRILTPDVSAYFENGEVSFRPGTTKPDLPEDACEALWVTYFRNIFNPARLKVQAMQSEMPKKYWKNLPEASAIPELISMAPVRAREMADAAPSQPPKRTEQLRAQAVACPSSWDGPVEDLAAGISACKRCPLHKNATQAVPGAGPLDADLMIVGEQPGDIEDLVGKPFVGPAGNLFDAVAESVGLDRRQAYVTNAVKHFKFQPRGKRRIHQRPNSTEISHCKWWLGAEMAVVKPKLILAMGATAVEALTGSGDKVLARRGKIETTFDGVPVLITVHPSYILRQQEADAKTKTMAKLKSDLIATQRLLGRGTICKE